MKKAFIAYIFLIIFLAVVGTGSTVRLDKVNVLYFRADHLIHAVLFIPWAYFCIKLNKNLPLWLLWGILFAIGSEGLQYWLSYRSFNISDILANVLGVVAGFCIFIPLLKLKSNPKFTM